MNYLQHLRRAKPAQDACRSLLTYRAAQARAFGLFIRDASVRLVVWGRVTPMEAYNNKLVLIKDATWTR